MFRPATMLAFRPAGIYRYHPHVLYACRAIGTAKKKQTNPKRKTASSEVIMEEETTSTRGKQTKYQTAYSRVSMPDAQKRLGFRFRDFEEDGMPVSQMLAETKPQIEGLSNDQIQQIKQTVFNNMVQFIQVEGYPTESDENFKEANVNDLVLLTIFPILAAFRCETGHKVELLREKEIIATDSETGGTEEFVGMSVIGVGNQKFVFVVEAKKASIGQAKKQCMLALKDMGDNNGAGIGFGFVTTGEQWQMICYDCKVFTQTDRFQVLYHSMGHKKEKWMKEASIIVDCIHTAIRSGGFVAA
ncbi:unnamed protein product [Tuber aestivum]|uniref:Uncharacterized protein n=1 Tax=Tuber aestivum TaxID=59557 RepID=A0A292PX05_9PEZI|nr:unnamed protein product [Tuber aestivum]